MNLFFLLLQQQQQPVAAASCHHGWKTIDRFEIVYIFYACCARRRGRQFTTLLSPAWPNKTMRVAVSCCRRVCDERPNGGDNNMCGRMCIDRARCIPKRRANTNTIKLNISTIIIFIIIYTLTKTHWKWIGAPTAQRNWLSKVFTIIVFIWQRTQNTNWLRFLTVDGDHSVALSQCTYKFFLHRIRTNVYDHDIDLMA